MPFVSGTSKSVATVCAAVVLGTTAMLFLPTSPLAVLAVTTTSPAPLLAATFRLACTVTVRARSDTHGVLGAVRVFCG